MKRTMKRVLSLTLALLLTSGLLPALPFAGGPGPGLTALAATPLSRVTEVDDIPTITITHNGTLSHGYAGGNYSANIIQFVLNLSHASTVPVSVDYSFLDGSFIRIDEHFYPRGYLFYPDSITAQKSGTIVFASGQTQKSIVMATNGIYPNINDGDLPNGELTEWIGARHYFLKFYNPVMAKLDPASSGNTATEFSTTYRFNLSTDHNNMGGYSLPVNPELKKIIMTKDVPYRPGDMVPITLEFNEAVVMPAGCALTVNDQPAPLCGNGGTGKWHSFYYTVQDADNVSMMEIKFPSGFTADIVDLEGNPLYEQYTDAETGEHVDMSNTADSLLIYGVNIEAPVESMAIQSLTIDKTVCYFGDTVEITLKDHTDERISQWLRSGIHITNELGGAYIAIKDPAPGGGLDTYPFTMTYEPTTGGGGLLDAEYKTTIPMDKYIMSAEPLSDYWHTKQTWSWSETDNSVQFFPNHWEFLSVFARLYDAEGNYIDSNRLSGGVSTGGGKGAVIAPTGVSSILRLTYTDINGTGFVPVSYQHCLEGYIPNGSSNPRYNSTIQIALLYGSDVTRDADGNFSGGTIAYDKLFSVGLFPPIWATGITVGGYNADADGYYAATRTIYSSSYTAPLTLTATVEPYNTDFPDIKWSSSNTAVAIIDEDTGEITPVSDGKVRFTATSDNLGIGTPVTADTPEFTVDSSGVPFINIIKSYNTRAGEALTVNWVTNLHILDSATDFTFTLKDSGGATVTSVTEKQLVSYTIPENLLTTLSDTTPAYTFTVSAADPQMGGTLTATGYIYVYPQPARITFDDLGGDMYITDQKSSVTLGFTVENLLPGDDFALSVYKNGDTTGFVHTQDAFIAGHNEFTFPIDPVSAGLKDTYSIMAIGSNASGACSAATVMYVYDHDALEIMIADADGSHVPHDGTLTLSNRNRIADLYNTSGSQGILDLKRDIHLQRFISINYGDHAWGVITDQIEWLSDDTAAATVNYRQGTLYEPLGVFTYTKYSPGTTFALAGVGDGESTVTATHSRTRQSVSIDLTVETLTDKLYLFQFYPRQVTKVNYVNGGGDTVDLTSDSEGALAVYEPSGIASDISLQSGGGDMVYLGTIYNDRLKSGEYNSANRGLYPVNIMKLNNTKLEVYLKGYTGNVIYSGAVYKNGQLCPETIIPRTQNKTLDTGASGRFLLNLDASKFWIASNTEELGMHDKLEFEFVLECGTNNGYYPIYLRVDGNLTRMETVEIGANTVQVRRNASGTPNPHIAMQKASSPQTGVKDVLTFDGRIGPGARVPDMTLTSAVLWWGEDPHAVYGAHLTSAAGGKLEMQTSLTRILPFMDMAITDNRAALNSRSIGPGSVLNLRPGGTAPVHFSAFDKDGRLVFSIQAPFTVANGTALVDPANDSGIQAATKELEEFIAQDLLDMDHIRGQAGGSMSRFEETMEVLEWVAPFVGFGLGNAKLSYAATSDPFIYTVEMSFNEGEWGDFSRESTYSAEYIAFNVTLWLKGEVRFDSDGKWVLVMTEGVGRLGIGTSVPLGSYQLSAFGIPLSIQFSFELGVDTSLQIIRNQETTNRYDTLISLLVSSAVKGRAGIGFPSEATGGVIGFYAGVYGKLIFNTYYADLRVYNKTTSDFYGFDAADGYSGTNLNVIGEVGAEAELTILFIGATFKYKIASWTLSNEDYGTIGKVREYLQKYGVRDYLGQLSVQSAAKQVHELYMAGQEAEAEALLLAYTGGPQMSVVEETTGWRMESRDYLSARDQKSVALKGYSQNAELQDDAYPYASPMLTDDGALIVYRSDGDVADINQANISWANGGASALPYTNPIDTGANALPAASQFDLAGKGSFAVAAWEAQREPVNFEDPDSPSNTEMDAMIQNAEIVAAVYNGAAWTTTRLTDNRQTDMAPAVAANGNSAFVVWKNMAGSGVDSGAKPDDPGSLIDSLHLGDVSSRLCYSVYEAGAWSTPEVLISNASAMANIKAAMLDDGTIALTYTSGGDVYCMIVDKNGTVKQDIRLTTENTNQNPQIQAVDFGGADGQQIVIGWHETKKDGGGNIRLTAVSGSGAVSENFSNATDQAIIGQGIVVEGDFRFAPNAAGTADGLSILWSELIPPENETAAASALLYGVKLCRDTDGFYFSVPHEAAETVAEEQFTSFDGWYDETSDTLHAVALIRHWAETGNKGSRISGATTVFTDELKVSAEVNQEEIVHDFDTAIPFYVTNAGSSAVTAVTITLSDGTAQTYTNLRILPNQTAQLNLAYRVPVNKNAIKDLGYTVTATFAGGAKTETGTLDIAIPNIGVTSIEPVSAANGERTFQVSLQNLSDVEFDGNTAGYTAHLGIYTDNDGQHLAKDAAGKDMIYTLTGAELELLDASALTRQITYKLPDVGFTEGDIRLYAKAWAEESGVEVAQYYQNGTGSIVFSDPVAANGGNPIKLSVNLSNAAGVSKADVTVTNLALTPAANGNLVVTLLGPNGEVLETLLYATTVSGLINLGKEESKAFPFTFTQAGYSVQASYYTADINAMNADLASLRLSAIAFDFDKDKTQYNDISAKNLGGTTLTAAAVNPAAQLSVRDAAGTTLAAGTGAVSYALRLPTGDTSVFVVVQPEASGAAAQTYELSINNTVSDAGGIVISASDKTVSITNDSEFEPANWQYCLDGEWSAEYAWGASNSFQPASAAYLALYVRAFDANGYYMDSNTLSSSGITDKELTPAVSIDYANETLTGFVNGGVYTFNGGAAVTVTGTTRAIDAGWFGTSVAIVKKGGVNTEDSDAQNLSVPDRPNTPAPGKTDCTTAADNDGSITGVTTAMEYQKNGDADWTVCSGTAITGLTPGTYYVRVKATGAAFKSEPATVTIVSFTGKELTPAVSIDYVNETLTGFVNGGVYTFDGGPAVTITGTTRAIDTSWFGTSVAIVKKGGTDSDALNLSIPARPNIPAPGSIKCTTAADNDGSITGVTTAMEYQKSGGTSWTACTGTVITGLTPGIYHVRVKATAGSFKSEPAMVTVGSYNSVKESTPAVSVNYVNETLTGFVNGGVYTFNGGPAVTVTGTTRAIDTSWFGSSVAIVRKGDGVNTTDSDAQSLSVPARPNTPAPGKTDCTTAANNDGSITGVTTAMEYQMSGGTSWTACTGTVITGLTPGTYYVRVKATAGNFKSEPATVTIGSYTGGGSSPSSPSPSTPAAASSVLVSGVSVSYTKKDGVVTLALTDSKVKDIISNAKDKTVIFDLTGVKDAKAAVLNVSAAKAFSDAGVTVTIKLPNAAITLTPDALGKIAATTNDGKTTVTVEASLVPMKDLKGLQAAQVKGYETVVNIDVLVGKDKVNVPMTVSIPYKLKKGEDPKGVCVWHLDDKGNMTRLNGTYDEKTGMITFTVNHQSLYVVGYDPVALWVNPFSDVYQGGTFYDAIAYVSHYGFVSGDGKGYFMPEGTLTRAMFATLVWNLEGKPKLNTQNSQFTDVPDGTWYTQAVQWAAENGIVQGGGDGTFNPNGTLTRQEMAALLYNYAVFKEYDIPVNQQADNQPPTDAWAETAARKLMESGALLGIDGGLQDDASRAEVAQLFKNFLRFIAGK